MALPTGRSRPALAFVVVAAVASLARAAPAEPIDRQALVSRHDPVVEQFDPESPLSVGNGQFAFTADVTGLQTFAEAYDETIPLGTLSHWGWHTGPNPRGWTIEKYHFTEFDAGGRQVGYADIAGDRRTPEVNYLRSNPHRLHLGRIGFRLTKADGSLARPSDLSKVHQTLRLWDGVLVSRFELEGQPVEVHTLCHPTLDLLAVRVESPLLASGQLAIELRFPYGTGDVTTADWDRPEAHETKLTHVVRGSPDPARSVARSGDRPQHAAHFARTLDDDAYHVAAQWSPAGTLAQTARHDFRVTPAKDAESLEFVCHFTPEMEKGVRTIYRDGPTSPPIQSTNSSDPFFDETAAAARAHWNRFWSTGGAIDLSGSSDPRWRELERRIVLSQYLTAIQCAGQYPPAETGLTFNSWYGKFHLEMHWWHAVHFALWDRWPMLERSLDYYQAILPRARATAERQGYAGARWPKMTDPSGAESPSTVGPFLIWQQPHPIYYAELAYRQPGAGSGEQGARSRKLSVLPTPCSLLDGPDPLPAQRATLEKYRDVVFATADFMASYPRWDAEREQYDLGPVLQCAQERFPKDHTLNPTFELTYWRWGLETAQRWRERLGMPREPNWDRVLEHLAKPLVVDGKYAFTETTPDSYTNPRWNDDHPTVLAAFGMLPGPGIDRPTMRRTFDWVWDNWNWPDTWGWDYPLVAMTAARLGQADRAVDALLLDTPKNFYRTNGHNHQRPGLTIYLPGNGGLLTAAAMMAAGWDGAPDQHAPGFPDDGTWHVRWEGLRRIP